MLVGLSLAVPASPERGARASPSAYRSGNSLLAMGEDGRILFEADIYSACRRRRYAEKACTPVTCSASRATTSCACRRTSTKASCTATPDEFQTASNPDRWAGAAMEHGIHRRRAFFGATTGAAVSSLSESEQPDNQTVSVKCYQRLEIPSICP
ncbi:MAG: hypothetical protein ACLSVD_12325 [Eggerthellaceae bacterium]